MAKPGNFLGSRSMPKAVKVGGATPGASTHVRSLLAAGEKAPSVTKVAAAADSPHVMPVKHSASTTTRTVHGGTEGF